MPLRFTDRLVENQTVSRGCVLRCMLTRPGCRRAAAAAAALHLLRVGLCAEVSLAPPPGLGPKTGPFFSCRGDAASAPERVCVPAADVVSAVVRTGHAERGGFLFFILRGALPAPPPPLRCTSFPSAVAG